MTNNLYGSLVKHKEKNNNFFLHGSAIFHSDSKIFYSDINYNQYDNLNKYINIYITFLKDILPKIYFDGKNISIENIKNGKVMDKNYFNYVFYENNLKYMLNIIINDDYIQEKKDIIDKNNILNIIINVNEKININDDDNKIIDKVKILFNDFYEKKSKEYYLYETNYDNINIEMSEKYNNLKNLGKIDEKELEKELEKEQAERYNILSKNYNSKLKELHYDLYNKIDNVNYKNVNYINKNNKIILKNKEKEITMGEINIEYDDIEISNLILKKFNFIDIRNIIINIYIFDDNKKNNNLLYSKQIDYNLELLLNKPIFNNKLLVFGKMIENIIKKYIIDIKHIDDNDIINNMMENILNDNYNLMQFILINDDLVIRLCNYIIADFIEYIDDYVIKNYNEKYFLDIITYIFNKLDNTKNNKPKIKIDNINKLISIILENNLTIDNYKKKYKDEKYKYLLEKLKKYYCEEYKNKKST